MAQFRRAPVCNQRLRLLYLPTINLSKPRPVKGPWQAGLICQELCDQLHNQFERELDLARAVPLTTDGTKGAVINRAIRSAEAHAVEGVEELGAELHVPLALVEVVVLERREVEVLFTILAQLRHHARRVAEGEGRREREGRPIEPLRQLVGLAAFEVGVAPVPSRTL